MCRLSDAIRAVDVGQDAVSKLRDLLSGCTGHSCGTRRQGRPPGAEDVLRAKKGREARVRRRRQSGVGGAGVRSWFAGEESNGQ